MLIIDPGHGKLQAGKRSFDGTFAEYIFNREVTRYLTVLLRESNHSFVITTPDFDYNKLTFDYNYPVGQWLQYRVKFANRFPKKSLFLSIHADAFGTTWSTPRGNHVLYNPVSSKSEAFARQFANAISLESGLKLRGITPRTDLTVLNKTTMPAILTENGFYSNKEELELLKHSDMQQKIALGHYKAIIENERLIW